MQPDQEAARALSAELLATVGHELRGPLTTIQGYATTLLRHEQHLSLQERRDFLSAISEASTHLGRLVDRFLQLAQLETRAQVLFPEQVHMRALVQEAITAAQKGKPHHMLLVPSSLREPEESPELADNPWILEGDRRLLRTLLDLLLENALTYSAPESLIEVSVEATDGSTSQAVWQTADRPGTHRELIMPATFHLHERLLLLRVRDHGIGIEPAHLALIFQRFYRVDSSLTRVANGLGLGLALCQEIVALHRGMLWVESAVGEGSTFSIVLPTERTEATRD